MKLMNHLNPERHITLKGPQKSLGTIKEGVSELLGEISYHLEKRTPGDFWTQASHLNIDGLGLRTFWDTMLLMT